MLPVDRLNFCKKGPMSICTAGSVNEQKKCRFYKKSSYGDRCMYFIFDKYCDSLEAQLNDEVKDAPEIL